jgi:hypothetical protein
MADDYKKVADFLAAERTRLVEENAELVAALEQLDMAHNHKTLCRAKERARAAISKARP